MDVVSVAHGSFDAGHVLDGDPRCDREGHGHSWQVRVELTGSLDPRSGQVRGSQDLEVALDKLLWELRNRNLNQMLPGVIPTAIGVASWVMERLLLSYPRISACEVRMGEGVSGRVVRPQRD